MAFQSVAELLEAASHLEEGDRFSELIIRDEAEQDATTRDAVFDNMDAALEVMIDASASYVGSDRSESGLSGGQAATYSRAVDSGLLLGSPYLHAVTAEALKTAESNACMKRIVAAPTAGSCGVIPAVLLPLLNDGTIDRETAVRALFIAGAFGEVIATRATVAGAAGGCQAEIGSASAMAAAALVDLQGGSPEQCAHAAAMALTNLMGLVCDPIAGLVEVPCVKRNVVGAVNAISAADMTMAGIASRIPPDEVIDAMRTIGRRMDPGIRETGTGGLAATPTAERIRKQIRAAKQGS